MPVGDHLTVEAGIVGGEELHHIQCGAFVFFLTGIALRMGCVECSNANQ